MLALRLMPRSNHYARIMPVAKENLLCKSDAKEYPLC